ncbi:MAG: hypothetical protein H0U87_05240 [Acidobacteria bacterium]|nr:hypothetical protein [Acidobacteriota bacterium]
MKIFPVRISSSGILIRKIVVSKIVLGFLINRFTCPAIGLFNAALLSSTSIKVYRTLGTSVSLSSRVTTVSTGTPADAKIFAEISKVLPLETLLIPKGGKPTWRKATNGATGA